MRWTVALTVLILTATLVVGCCKPQVMVPVSSCPAPPVMTMPRLQVDQLAKRPETSAALRALAIDNAALKSTLEQCLTTLEGYRSK